jgi:hypothetical protein
MYRNRLQASQNSINRSYSTVSMKPPLVAPVAFDADCWPYCDSGNCMDFLRGWTLFELQKRVDQLLAVMEDGS